MKHVFDLTGLNCLVTGAARGIGFASAHMLGSLGANVWIVDLDDPGDSVDKLRAAYPNQKFAGTALDVRDEKAVAGCVDTMVTDFGSISVLVNNAGTASRKGLNDISAEEWERDLNTNLKGTFNFIRSALYPHMIDAGSGSIVNISSISGINGGAPSSGEVGGRSGPAYAASKGGIIALTKWVAKEVGRYGIRVNSVAPGPVESALTAGQSYDLSGQAIQRMGKPEDIASAVAYLTSNGSTFVTGQVIRVDGGAVMA